MKISIIGLGFVGNAMYTSFLNKGLLENHNLFGFDKYKNGGIGSLENCINTDIIFLALPTKFDKSLGQYDKIPIIETCLYLSQNNYQGVIVIKSTVEPETTNNLSSQFPSLHFIHNPEFLTARTAYEDFHNQKHIVLGKGPTCPTEKLQLVKDFYNKLYPEADISICSSLESESMKIFCNCFYSIKIQFFTELYLLCQSNNCDFNLVKNMMLKNSWINPMHTTIPGPDGQLSYGGLCFPKDTNALLKYFEKNNIPSKVLEATIQERNLLRNDNENIE
jgi:nucleotide sugar dehydrogenase